MKKKYNLIRTMLVACFLVATCALTAADKSDKLPVQKCDLSIQKSLEVASTKIVENKLTLREKFKIIKEIRKETKKAGKTNKSGTPMIILYILAIILPPVAVGIYTNWGLPTLWNLLFTILFWIPGIIHAFYILLR